MPREVLCVISCRVPQTCACYQQDPHFTHKATEVQRGEGTLKGQAMACHSVTLVVSQGLDSVTLEN